MKERIRNLLVKNLGWKILALVFAILAWFAYINLKDPVETETITGISVQVLNYDGYIEDGNEITFEDSSLNIDNLTVNVTVKARKSVITALRKKRSALYVWVDLYELKQDDDRLMIHYEIDPDYKYTFSSLKFVDVSNTSYYEVETERSITAAVPVEYSIIGTPAEGYTYVAEDANIHLNPDTVYLTGPESIVDTVSYAAITASVEGAKANVDPVGPISFYDADGDPVYLEEDTVTASANTAALFVPIYKIKEITLDIDTTGEVPSGYQYLDDLSLSKDTVKIYGEESELSAIDTITLPAVDLSQYQKSGSVTYDLNDVLASLYPDTVIKAYDSDSTVEASFTIEKETTETVEVPVDQIQIISAGSRTITFDDETVDVSLTGASSLLNKVEPSDIRLRISLKDVSDGKQKLTATVVSVPKGLKAADKTISVSADVESSDE